MEAGSAGQTALEAPEGGGFSPFAWHLSSAAPFPGGTFLGGHLFPGGLAGPNRPGDGGARQREAGFLHSPGTFPGVLVVTHAGVISQVVGCLGGISPARWECCRPL